MINTRVIIGAVAALLCVVTLPAGAQSFQVQCPADTITHPAALHDNNSEPAYTAATTLVTGAGGYLKPSANVNGAIKCQQISGGDGFSTMGDGTQTYMFSFGPLSGLADIAQGKPGTEFPQVFNTVGPTLYPGDPAKSLDPGGSASANGTPIIFDSRFTYNGAVGLTGDTEVLVPGSTGTGAAAVVLGANIGSGAPGGGTGTQVLDVTLTNGGSGYNAPPSVTIDPPACAAATPAICITAQAVAYVNSDGTHPGQVTDVVVNYTGQGYDPLNPPLVHFGPGSNDCSGANPPAQCLTGHVDPRPMMDVGVMNGNIPAPLMAIDEDDEFFLTLSNVGMIMRPDLFEQHTVHFHGYPNASAFYDGVPDASVAINIAASFTYYYLAPDAGTYFWHCHITPPEHLQMGMVGQLYVRPRQDRVPSTTTLYAALQAQQGDLRTKCDSTDILCSNPLPAGGDNGAKGAATLHSGGKSGYAYNDGDGSTYYDLEYPLQIHGFDPNFHFVGMTFNPEGFTDMKDKYFLLNGRSYPDTVTPGPLETQSTDGSMHFAQPLPSIISIPAGKKALLRISDLDVSEYQTLASLGIPMQVIGYNAKLLRDQAGNNLYYKTNSITLAGGESLDVILDATGYTAGQVFYLYTPNLDHLSNDAENFGGLMTEVHII